MYKRQPLTVVVNGDRKVEADETFKVQLSAPTGASLGDFIGVGTILNDDLPTIRINDVSKNEGNSGPTAYTFTVALSAASTEAVTVRYVTANGSALAGSDYTAVPLTTLTFSPGQTTRTFTVKGRGDVTVEANETFSVNLSAPDGATLLDSQGVGTILNDDR